MLNTRVSVHSDSEWGKLPNINLLMVHISNQTVLLRNYILNMEMVKNTHQLLGLYCNEKNVDVNASQRHDC